MVRIYWVLSVCSVLYCIISLNLHNKFSGEVFLFILIKQIREFEAQIGYIICPRSHRPEMVELGLMMKASAERGIREGLRVWRPLLVF